MTPSSRRPEDLEDVSPKDRFVTVYGRRPVMEALGDPALSVDKVVVADGLDPHSVRPVLEAAAARGVRVQRATAHRVKVLAGNGRQDQGMVADVAAPRMRTVERFLTDLDERAGGTGGVGAAVLVLDGVTTPANVGMILRSATAAGLDGVLLPRRGVPAIDPMVVKASAGIAFHAPVLRAGTAAAGLAALAEGGFVLLGLEAGTGAGSLFGAAFAERVALVVGGETDGLSEEVRGELHGTLAIPMTGGVESLNAACAATVAAYELARRRPTPPTSTETPANGSGAA